VIARILRRQIDIVHRLSAEEALPGGATMHIVVLRRDMLAERDGWQAVVAQRLSNPVNLRAVAVTLDALVGREV